MRQVLIGSKDDPPGFKRIDHGSGICRGCADVAFRFDRGGRIDIGDHGGIGIFLLILAQRCGCNHVRHGAAGRLLGKQNYFVRSKDSRAFSHEMNAAENYDLGLDGRGDAAELK